MATMVLSTDHVRYWGPRIVGFFAVGLLMLLASDAHEAGLTTPAARNALLIHLVPAGIVFCLLLVAWRWELIGAVGFPLLGLFYVGGSWGRVSLGAHLLISGTLILAGVLFLIDWIQGQQEASRR
jgi:hypothetical protein